MKNINLEKYKKCLYPDCQDIVRSRGLCNNHYSSAFNLVKYKKTSWEELVKKGKALDKTKGPRDARWFLE